MTEWKLSVVTGRPATLKKRYADLIEAPKAA